jgi:hypothetical protein
MSKFVTVDVIGKKRDKKELTTDEIKFVVDGFTSGAIADYQMSALLMAIVVLFYLIYASLRCFASLNAAQWNEQSRNCGLDTSHDRQWDRRRPFINHEAQS